LIKTSIFVPKGFDLTAEDFVPKPYGTSLTKESVAWKTPSNIALVKYWGKTPPQLPQNPSLSFTLNNCHTITSVVCQKKKILKARFSFDIFFEGLLNEAFKPKIETFFERIQAYLPFVKDYHFSIRSENSFPHSSGIASSASGMGALSLCLMSIEKMLFPDMSEAYFYQKASFIARLGSGSACRSVKGKIVVWGAHPEISGSSDLFGVPVVSEIAPVFQDYQDTILLVDKGEKQVSSTVGHDLMHGHPFAKKRFEQATENLSTIKSVLTSGNLADFVKLVESEALTLHAMMMTSHPYFILMKPKTLEIINKVWSYRARTNSQVCFTLDAGANVHLLYPKREAAAVREFIDSELRACCENGQLIHDEVGLGAQEISVSG
jgi:diphosphomevalonate decarboxylase